MLTGQAKTDSLYDEMHNAFIGYWDDRYGEFVDKETYLDPCVKTGKHLRAKNGVQNTKGSHIRGFNNYPDNEHVKVGKL